MHRRQKQVSALHPSGSSTGRARPAIRSLRRSCAAGGRPVWSGAGGVAAEPDRTAPGGSEERVGSSRRNGVDATTKRPDGVRRHGRAGRREVTPLDAANEGGPTG